MNFTWIRRLYDAGTRLEIRADRLIERIIGKAIRRRFASKKRRR